MEGIIVNFRGGKRTPKNNQMIINIAKTKEEAKSLVNKEIIWKSPKGKEIKGLITKEHGNKGAVRAKFEKGMPGQSIGTKIEVK